MIGIDEAGYGPNLGPLVVAATVWHVEATQSNGSSRPKDLQSEPLLPDLAISQATEQPPVDLYKRLNELVSTEPKNGSLAIADSKKLYKPQGGLRQLERGVLTALSVTNKSRPTQWSELITGCAGIPWYEEFDCELPIDAEPEEIATLAEQFTSTCKEQGVQLHDVRTRLVYPREFNELIEEYGTKSAALSHISIGLLRQVVDHLPTHPTAQTEEIRITCDKHGARNRYAALLQHHFSEQWINTLAEGPVESRYSWDSDELHFEVCFRARGENELPTALASMTAKYHRELAMRAFNSFWCNKVSELKATAGYPLDAKRFKSEIAEQQLLLRIKDVDLWRIR